MPNTSGFIIEEGKSWDNTTDGWPVLFWYRQRRQVSWSCKIWSWAWNAVMGPNEKWGCFSGLLESLRKRAGGHWQRPKWGCGRKLRLHVTGRSKLPLQRKSRCCAKWPPKMRLVSPIERRPHCEYWSAMSWCFTWKDCMGLWKLAREKVKQLVFHLLWLFQ